MSILRQPLVHFAVLGALIFGAFTARDRWRRARAPSSPDSRVIVVRPELVRSLRNDAARRAGSVVTPEIERASVQAYVDEEILYREALSLGLDRGDPIVRRRLVQEMETILRGLGARPEPDDRELTAWVEAHRERYLQPARVAFRHVFVSREQRGFAGADAARALFAQLDGRPAERGIGLGDAFSMGSDVALESEREVAATFGPAVATALMRAPAGRWFGPVEAPSGWFVLHVRERLEARLPPIDEIRTRASEDLRVDHGDRAFGESLRQLRARYRVR